MILVKPVTSDCAQKIELWTHLEFSVTYNVSEIFMSFYSFYQKPPLLKNSKSGKCNKRTRSKLQIDFYCAELL